MPTCKQCNQQFTIYPEDKTFYQRIDVPEPTLCPDCREQRRLASRNERVLYSRTCDLCKKNIISIYDKDALFPVYCPDCWWSDKWDPLDYSKVYNSNQPFFNQYKEFSNKVPHISLINRLPENSDFVNDTNNVKNCYLVFGTDLSENSYYGTNSIKMNNCVDFSWSLQCDQCYECIDNANCYNSHFCQFSKNLTDCWFCYDCSDLQSCLGCCGLHHKKFNIFNQQYSEADYQNKINEFKIHTREGLNKVQKEYENFLLKYPRRYATANKSENCTGDVIVNSEDSINVFDVNEIKNTKYIYSGYQLKDSYDVSISGLNSSELLYETQTCLNKGHRVMFSIFCWYCNHVQYSQYCFNCQDCFACFGLKKGKYFIFNKEYSEADYNKLKEKIILQMKSDNEYGEFWPVKHSPFAYNETKAIEYYPLTKEQVLSNNWAWKDKERKAINQSLPICAGCNENFKIIPQEIEFYKKHNLLFPEKCPNCRHLDRMKKKNPRKLWHRQCMCEYPSHGHQGRCANEFKTTYAPDRPGIVLCEDCYQKTVY